MYYWNVALSEHCEDVPLECGSVHWNTEEVCEVAPFTQCHCWDEEAAQFRQERDLQKVASQQIVRQPLVVAYQQKELHCRMCNAQERQDHVFPFVLHSTELSLGDYFFEPSWSPS